MLISSKLKNLTGEAWWGRLPLNFFGGTGQVRQSNRAGNRAAEVLPDVQVDLAVTGEVQAQGIKGIEHQGRHHEVGEEELGGAGGHELLAGELGGVAVPGPGDLRVIAAKPRGQVPAVAAEVDLEVAVLKIVAPGDEGEVSKSGGVLVRQVAGGVVVHHEEDDVAGGNEAGGVVSR